MFASSKHPLLRWSARLLIGLVALVAVGLALAYRFNTTPVWWIELARYAPYPVYLVPALGALVMSIWAGWLGRLTAVAALALILTEVMGLATAADQVPHPEDAGRTPTIRLMTYNIKTYRAVHAQDGYARLAEEISSHRPDVVVMQDASDAQGGPPQPLFELLPQYQYRFAAGQYALASRYPLQGCRLADLSFPGKKSDYVHCLLQVEGSEVDLIDVHLLTPRKGLNAARHDQLDGVEDWQSNFSYRHMQARILVDGLLRLRRPVIVAGDLNAPEHSPVVRALLDTGLVDAYSAAGTGYGYTIGHAMQPHISFLRIDHILVTPMIGVSHAFVGGKEASEHRPVIADLVLPAPARSTNR